jgi:hypothetical protein
MNTALETSDRVLIYSNAKEFVVQLRHQTPTEEDVLASSFKVSVLLHPARLSFSLGNSSLW